MASEVTRLRAELRERHLKWWRRFVLVFAGLVVAGVHAPILGYKAYANVDEGYAAALASRLLDGHRLYQGAISQRGPLMYYGFELVAWLHGWDNIVALRVWALGLALVQVYLTYVLARRFLSPSAATVAAGLMSYIMAFGLPPEDCVAINGETMQAPALLIAVLTGALAIRCAPGSRQRRLMLLGTGVLLGIAISIKQAVALHPLPILVWMLVDRQRRGARIGTVAVDGLVLGLGCLLVPAALALHAAAQGTLADMYYYTVVYNRDVHLRPTTKHFEWLPGLFIRLTSLTGFFVATAVLAGCAFPWCVRRVRSWRRLRSLGALGRGFGATHYFALHFAVAMFSATSMWRFFPHYYVQAAPFMALCAAAIVDRPFHRREPVAAKARVVSAVLMSLNIFACTLGAIFGEHVDGRVAHDETPQTVAHVIEATTSPEDRVFVWGFSPWIYGYSHRKPAGRYVFETYVTGFVPWFWEKLEVERARIVPGSVEALLGDLDRERPAVIVDAGSVMMARPMRTYAKFDAVLQEHYCFDMRIGAFDLYRRKSDGAVCAQPYFPRPFATTDYMGRLMGIATPIQIDATTEKRLPTGPYFKPIYFPCAPPPPGLEAAKWALREKQERKGAADGFFIPTMEWDVCP